MKILDDIAISFGSAARETVELIGSISLFFWRVMLAFPSSFKRFHLVTDQMMMIGVASIPIVLLTSAFIGAVTAWQAQYMFQDAIPLTLLGTAVGKAVITEIGPVLTALVITGRVGAKLAAELGTMKVTEQIDAMTCLSLDPFCYLLAPRMAAAFIMVPVLIIFSTAFSMVSAQIVAEMALGLEGAIFWQGVRLLFKVTDVVVCLVKAFVFGGVIALSGCYYGFLTQGGAVGVGRSTKKAVVAAMVMILICNLLVVNILL